MGRTRPPPHVNSELKESPRKSKKSQQQDKTATVSPIPTKRIKKTPTLTPSGTSPVFKDVRDLCTHVPSNGKFYTPKESMQYLSKSIKDMLNNEKITNMINMKYIPIGKLSMYNMWTDYKLTSNTPDELHLKGLLSIISVQKLNSIIDKHFESTGQILTSQDLSKFLNKAKNKITGNETSSSNKTDVHSTIQNYCTLSGTHNNRQIFSKVKKQRIGT